MTIKLEVGQKVKFRNGQTGKVTRYRKIYPSDFIPYEVKCDAINHSVNLNEQGIKHPEIDGYESGYDVVEILKEEEEMAIKLEVGQNVKCRNGLEGVVIDYFVFNDEDIQPFQVLLNGQKDAVWYTEDGYYFSTKDNHKWDIVKILKEEEEPMETKEIKVRYFEEGNLMFIQNVKESSIMVLDVFHNEIVSVMDYGTPIKAKEQMYTYATLLEVEEVKSH